MITFGPQKKRKFPIIYIIGLSFIGLSILGMTLWKISQPRHLNRPIVPFSVPLQTKRYPGMIATHGSREKRWVALTFDADMTPSMKKKLSTGEVKSWYNQEVVQALESNHAKATLFLTGMWVEVYPREAKLLADNPLFEIANHSYNHPGFTLHCYTLQPLITQAAKQFQIIHSQEVIQHITGKTPAWFRFPGGCESDSDDKLVGINGMGIARWDVVSGDAFEKDPRKIAYNLETKVQNGSIVVLHMHGGPNAPATGEALKIALPILKQKGFQFVTLSQMFND